jgi:hypothetical protein
MDQPRRLSEDDVARILRAGGVEALTSASPYQAVVTAITMTARLVANAYINDIAMVYHATVIHMTKIGLEAPWVTEDVFFNPFNPYKYEEEEWHGEDGAHERRELRASGGEVDARNWHQGRAQPHRDAGGQQWGRASRVDVATPDLSPPRDTSEASEESEPMEGDGGSGDRWDLPF